MHSDSSVVSCKHISLASRTAASRFSAPLRWCSEDRCPCWCKRSGRFPWKGLEINLALPLLMFLSCLFYSRGNIYHQSVPPSTGISSRSSVLRTRTMNQRLPVFTEGNLYLDLYLPLYQTVSCPQTSFLFFEGIVYYKQLRMWIYMYIHTWAPGYGTEMLQPKMQTFVAFSLVYTVTVQCHRSPINSIAQ